MSCYGLGTDEPSFPGEYKRNGFDEDGNSIFNIFHSCLKTLQVILTRVLNRDTQPLPHSFHIHILSAAGEDVSFCRGDGRK